MGNLLLILSFKVLPSNPLPALIQALHLALCSSRSRPVFPQIATQIVQKPPSDLRCSSRAWKVTLIGEAADDAGGVFDETIALMCEVGGQMCFLFNITVRMIEVTCSWWGTCTLPLLPSSIPFRYLFLSPFLCIYPLIFSCSFDFMIF